ncbi:uncharacterized protein SCHCODRAFT_02662450 [Schizophyllum commune H4-8]|uniref:uncharacterized protein n=1 Tax=Schizophyllum commune (strain H4-8 / FGSC 9210) TaxID=578458 RepID=UPI00215FF07B|nr:uncharacterized protein SCHCODRAFT_02662450 [Schizophyllum commune H4-8]KAI5897453.1 hypothetical protein SCHCODRAFT_02662450 [Schizophyllum commune H4-8]
MVEINGARAYALWDAGGTLDSLSPEYARASGTKVYHLDNPVDLQLGCTGSRSRVSFGATATVRIGGDTVPTYVDVANIDRYDAILGVPFMHANGITLDLAHRRVLYRGKELPVLSEGEEKETKMNRKQREDSARRRRTPKIETLEDDTPQQVNATPELWESDSACMSQAEFEEYRHELDRPRTARSDNRRETRRRTETDAQQQPDTATRIPASNAATAGSDDWLWRGRPPQPGRADPPSKWDYLQKKARKFARREQIRGATRTLLLYLTLATA